MATVKAKKQLAHKRTLRGAISFERRRTIEGVTFMTPWIIGFICFTLIPLVLSIRTSFYITKLTDLYGFQGDSKWVGIQNYTDVLSDPEFGQKVFESFLTSLYQVPVIVGFALFVAVLLKQKFPGRVYFRTTCSVTVSALSACSANWYPPQAAACCQGCWEAPLRHRSEISCGKAVWRF